MAAVKDRILQWNTLRQDRPGMPGGQLEARHDNHDVPIQSRQLNGTRQPARILFRHQYQPTPQRGSQVIRVTFQFGSHGEQRGWGKG